MFKDSYRKEIDNISASEKFKKDTISLMNQKQAELQQNNTNNNTIKFPSKKYGRIAASVAIITLSLLAFPLFASEFSLGFDSAEGGRNPDANMEQYVDNESATKNKDGEYDNLPANAVANKAEMRVYTINDAVAVETSDKKADNKIIFSTKDNGGYGYEAYLYYDTDNLITNNPYNTDMVFDKLSVYEYHYLTYQQMHDELDRVIEYFGITRDDLLDIKCHWIQVPDVYNNTTTTYSFDSPESGGVLNSIDVRFDYGTVSIDRGGIVDITVNTVVPEYAVNQQYTDYVLEKFGSLIGENTAVYSWFDRTYYGDINFHNSFYADSDDFSDKLFNSTVMDYAIFHLEDVVYETRQPGEGISICYICTDSYSDLSALPAISCYQALWMLYNGNYDTSVPQEITMNSVVNKIEMVYKEPPINYPYGSKEGVAVPFYKIYVKLSDLPERNPLIEANNGLLYSYGAYYVCAIHPDYITLTDDYIQFNGV